VADALSGTVADALTGASAVAAASAGDPGATAVIASVLTLPVALPRVFAAVTATQLRPDARIAAQFSAPAPSQLSIKSPATAGPANRASGPAVATTGLPADDAAVAPDADPAGPTPPAFKLDASLSGGSPLDLDAQGLDTSVTPAVGLTPQQTAQAAALHERHTAGVLHLDTQLPLQSPRFAEGFGQQVVVLAQNGIQQAQMSLNPPELGPIDVRITFHHDEASVQIAAASGLARETIQEALPRLRELMDSAGVRLNDAGVFAQLPQREQSPQGQVRSDWLIGQRQGDNASFDGATVAPTLLRRVGLIDAYA
jgi:flagellar hook-length control protein FliK